jgi:hypothetical protein
MLKRRIKTNMDQQLAAKYPEHMKLEAIPQSDRDAIGQFIEWLDSRGYAIARYREEGNNGEPRYIPATEADIAEIREYRGYEGYEGSAIECQALARGVENPNIVNRWHRDYRWHLCQERTSGTSITLGMYAGKAAHHSVAASQRHSPPQEYSHVRLQPIA